MLWDTFEVMIVYGRYHLLKIIFISIEYAGQDIFDCGILVLTSGLLNCNYSYAVMIFCHFTMMDCGFINFMIFCCFLNDLIIVICK